MSDIPSKKPYLVRAIYEWCVDTGFTPHLSVVIGEGVRVPHAFVRDGQIVLNIAPHATNKFQIDNEAMSCQARFGGVAHQLYVPMANIAAIYARENGQGMAFDIEEDRADQSSGEDSAITDTPDTGPGRIALATEAPPPAKSDDDDPTPPDGNRPRLRIVK